MSVDKSTVARIARLARIHVPEDRQETLSAELSVALVDDAAIHDLNRRFRDVDKSTDVLAFAMREGEEMMASEDELEVLGDVVISVPTATRQAEARSVSVTTELTMLLAHGLLHLIGYDHRNKREERVMLRRTQELENAAVSRR